MNMRMTQGLSAEASFSADDDVHRRQQKPLIAVTMASPSELEFEMLDGIRAGAGGWDVVVLSGGYETPLRRLAETGELAGAIGDFVSDAWVDNLRVRGVRIVQLAQGSRLSVSANIGADFHQMGHDAVDALLRNASREIGLVGITGQDASQQIRLGAGSHPGLAGITICETTVATLPLLQTWLAAMTRPCGVVAASDRLARMVIMAARNLDLKVPNDVAVIGIGNQRMESIFAGVRISSYELPNRAIGRAAADLMARMLADPRTRKPGDVFFPARLIERESSLRLPLGVSRAVAFAESHFAEAIQVDDLARAAGVSRRSLEIATREEHGVSPGALIAGVRRREAERLLKSEDLAVERIGALCGYPEPERFSAAFKRWTGLSPREFRRQIRASGSRRR
jgi:DNA-binding LacI/PurR family transcriptional regulator